MTSYTLQHYSITSLSLQHYITIITSLSLARRGSCCSCLVVFLSVHQLGENLPLMAPRVGTVCVLLTLLLTSLFASVSGVNCLVLVKVVVLVLIKVCLRHCSS